MRRHVKRERPSLLGDAVPPLRVVIDANIFAAGLLAKRQSSSAEILRLWRSGVFQVLLNGTLVNEIERTLARKHVSRDDIATLVDILSEIPDILVPIRHQRMGLRDERDDHLLETAIVGKAQIVVSRDRKVLDPPLHVENMLRREGIALMSDVEFLATIHGKIFSPLVVTGIA